MTEKMTKREVALAKRYLKESYENALESPDPSTQLGSMLVGEDFVVGGCNDIDCDVVSTEARLTRPLKYQYVEHAERSAIYSAARNGFMVGGATLYVPWFACADCARAIIGCGIVRVVGHRQFQDLTPDHWEASVLHGLTMLKEAGVKMDWYDGPIHAEPVLFGGKTFYPLTGELK